MTPRSGYATGKAERREVGTCATCKHFHPFDPDGTPSGEGHCESGEVRAIVYPSPAWIERNPGSSWAAHAEEYVLVVPGDWGCADHGEHP